MASCARLPVAVVSRWARGNPVLTSRLSRRRRRGGPQLCRRPTPNGIDAGWPCAKVVEPARATSWAGPAGERRNPLSEPSRRAVRVRPAGRTLCVVSPLTRRTGCVGDTRPRLERGIGSSDSRSDSPSRRTQERPLLSGGRTYGRECNLVVGPCPIDPGRPHPAAAADARIERRREPHRGEPPRDRVLAVAAARALSAEREHAGAAA
jgi:hypothetical protein